MDDNLKHTHTREIFNLNGTEEIPLGGLGTSHVTTRTLKDWFRENLENDLKINNIDNTSDANKPLSKAGKAYIDGNLSNVFNSINVLQTYVTMLDNKIKFLENEVQNLKK